MGAMGREHLWRSEIESAVDRRAEARASRATSLLPGPWLSRLFSKAVPPSELACGRSKAAIIGCPLGLESESDVRYTEGSHRAAPHGGIDKG